MLRFPIPLSLAMLSLSLLAACGKDGDTGSDVDGDGWVTPEDCDDQDPAVSPDAVEVWYDGVDQDCTGGSDYDADGDGDDAVAYDGGDCDDQDAAVNSLATEVWYDGIDQDCDGVDDDDADGDGYGQADDCDDTDATVYPGASETWYDGVDQDCAGASDNDADGDGSDGIAGGGDDCDDTEATVFPGAMEICDGLDNNCDGQTDEGARDTDRDGIVDCEDTEECDGLDNDGDRLVDEEPDLDGDGYSTCEDALKGGDCDDGDATANPGAVEVPADGLDNDCDGRADEGGGPATVTVDDGTFYSQWGYVWNIGDTTTPYYMSTYATGTKTGDTLEGGYGYVVYDEEFNELCSMEATMVLTEDTAAAQALMPEVGLGWSGTVEVTAEDCFEITGSYDMVFGAMDSDDAYTWMETNYEIPVADAEDADNTFLEGVIDSGYDMSVSGVYLFATTWIFWEGDTTMSVLGPYYYFTM